MEAIKEEFIKQSIIWNQNMIRNRQKATQADKRLLKIYKKIMNGDIDKEILVDLLNYDNPNVTITAATYLLGLGYKVNEALVKLDELQHTEFETHALMALKVNARMTIEIYQQQGYIEIL